MRRCASVGYASGLMSQHTNTLLIHISDITDISKEARWACTVHLYSFSGLTLLGSCWVST